MCHRLHSARQYYLPEHEGRYDNEVDGSQEDLEISRGSFAFLEQEESPSELLGYPGGIAWRGCDAIYRRQS